MTMLLDHLAAVCFLYGIGLPVAWVAVRSRALACFLAPVCTGLFCSFAAMASLGTATAFGPWLVGLVLAGWVAAGARWWSLRRVTGRPDEPARPAWWVAATVAAITAPALLATRAGAIDWDARSVWWFRGQWFRHGGEAARAAMNNAAFGFAHPDYPPYSSATVAGMWTMTDGLDRMLAKAVSAHLTFAAVALLGCLLVPLVPRDRPRLTAATAVFAGVFGLALFGVGNGNGTSGVVDVLWAALLVAGAVTLLIAPRDRDALLVGCVSLAAAGLTKSEALPAVLLVLLLVAIRNRRAWRPTLWASTALLPILAWTLLRSALTDAANDALRPSGVIDLLRGERDRTVRISPTVSGLWEQVDSTTWAWLAVAVVGVLLLRRRRAALGLGAAWVLPVVAAGIAAQLTLVYLTGDQDITWWLMTSISRTTIVVRMLLLADVFLWVVTAVVALRESAPITVVLPDAASAPAEIR